MVRSSLESLAGRNPYNLDLATARRVHPPCARAMLEVARIWTRKTTAILRGLGTGRSVPFQPFTAMRGGDGSQGKRRPKIGNPQVVGKFGDSALWLLVRVVIVVVPIFFRHIVLGNFVRVYFSFFVVTCVLHALDNFRLERVPFFKQFVHAL